MRTMSGTNMRIIRIRIIAVSIKLLWLHSLNVRQFLVDLTVAQSIQIVVPDNIKDLSNEVKMELV